MPTPIDIGNEVRQFRLRYPGGPLGSGAPYSNYITRMTNSSRNLNASPWDTCPLMANQDPYLMTWLQDDMICNNASKTTDVWNPIKGTGGVIAVASTAGGWLNIPTAAAATNDYQIFASQAAFYTLLANKPLWFEVGLSVTEANTNTSSWYAGFGSTTTTGFLQNSGAPPASYSGAMFWKAQGAMALSWQTSNATTQNTTATTLAVTSGTQYMLGMYINPNDGVTALVTPYISSYSRTAPLLTNLVSPALGNAPTLNLTIASLASMFFQFGVRTASASAETISVDFAQVVAFR